MMSKRLSRIVAESSSHVVVFYVLALSRHSKSSRITKKSVRRNHNGCRRTTSTAAQQPVRAIPRRDDNALVTRDRIVPRARYATSRTSTEQDLLLGDDATVAVTVEEVGDT